MNQVFKKLNLLRVSKQRLTENTLHNKNLEKMKNYLSICILLFFTTLQAQVQTISAGVNENSIQKATAQTYKDYKGLSGGNFIIQAMVKKKGEGNNFSVGIQTQSIYMDKCYSYIYKPGIKRLYCDFNLGEVKEEMLETESFSESMIGSEPFEKIKVSAEATFDIKVTFFVKNEKYTNGGYRVDRIFKNVKANSLYWDENPVNGDFDIAGVKILNNPKLVSFKADESAILPAINAYVKKYNKQQEAKCKK